MFKPPSPCKVRASGSKATDPIVIDLKPPNKRSKKELGKVSAGWFDGGGEGVDRKGKGKERERDVDRKGKAVDRGQAGRPEPDKIVSPSEADFDAVDALVAKIHSSSGATKAYLQRRLNRLCEQIGLDPDQIVDL